MKFGQALSVLEAALPEELAGPYREELTKLQDSAPPMPTQQVRDALARDLGPDWKRAARLARRRPDRRGLDRPGPPRPLARRPRRGVKVQYPGAGDALRSDLSQLSRLARTIGPLVPGIDIKPLIEEMQARTEEELDYRLEADAQRTFAAGFRDDPDFEVPDVVAAGDTSLVTEWMDSPSSLARIIAEGTAGGARPLRRALRALPGHRADAHRHAARGPAPRELPDPARARTAARGGWASSTSARSPGCPRASCRWPWVR